MYSQVKVRQKFILDEWLKNRNVLINSLTKKYKVQSKTVSLIIKSWGEGRGLKRKSRNRERGPSSLKLDQKKIWGSMQIQTTSFKVSKKKLVFSSR